MDLDIVFGFLVKQKKKQKIHLTLNGWHSTSYAFIILENYERIKLIVVLFVVRATMSTKRDS